MLSDPKAPFSWSLLGSGRSCVLCDQLAQITATMIASGGLVSICRVSAVWVVRVQLPELVPGHCRRVSQVH